MARKQPALRRLHRLNTARFPPPCLRLFRNPLTNTPGARYGGAGWTDSFGNLFLFGGDGWELSGNTSPDTLNAPMNDLWVCVRTLDYCEWQLVGGYDPTTVGGGSSPPTIGSAIIANAQHEGQAGAYTNLGIVLPTPIPGGRLGAATWTDTTGNFWLFGGSDGGHFLNDLWKYNTTAFNGTNYTTTEGSWTVVSGSGAVDQPGVYTSGTLVPGARTNAVTWTDGLGNFWLFGGLWVRRPKPGGARIPERSLGIHRRPLGLCLCVRGNANKPTRMGSTALQGTAASTNMPGGRQEAVGWADANGNLWLFGGEGQDATGTANGILNDLWSTTSPALNGRSSQVQRQPTRRSLSGATSRRCCKYDGCRWELRTRGRRRRALTARPSL